MTSKPLLIIPSLLLILLLITPVYSAKCNKQDHIALLKIKQFWGNPYQLASWTPDNGCCVWYGVDCDASGRVIGLAVFATDNITGTIPPAVGDLSMLRSLDLRKLPNLVGPIIPELARLTGLTSLRLDWNGLSGSVPAFIAALKNLTYLNFGFNRLTGSIPPELGSLPKLGALFLDRNQLTGSIPSSFSNFASNFYLILSHNNLSGPLPTSLGTVDFGKIDISRNELTGDASFLFGRSKTTQDIDISRNMFAFDLSKVEFPTVIDDIDLNHNMIFGSIPKQITEIENLQFLNVSYNRLCGEIPTGGQLSRVDESSYIHNKCLCGTPLPPCK